MHSFVYLCTALLWVFTVAAEAVSATQHAVFQLPSADQRTTTAQVVVQSKDGIVRHRNNGSELQWSQHHSLAYSQIYNVTASALGERKKMAIAAAAKKRNFLCYSFVTKTSDSDGNPHQNYRFQQVSDTVRCDTSRCAVSSSPGEFKATTRWSSSAPTENFGWTSAGFTVSRYSVSEGSFGCWAEPNEKVCLWHQADLTAYTVDEKQFCGLSSRKVGTEILYSPNNRQCGLEWHCRRGDDCAHKGATYDIKCGPPGAEDCDKRGDGFGKQYYDLPTGC